MSEILSDSTIKDFLLDYSLLKRQRKTYKDTQANVASQLPVCIKRFRVLAHSMTQQELADALEVDHSYVSKIEGGQSPSAEFLDRFAQFIQEWEQDEQE